MNVRVPKIRALFLSLCSNSKLPALFFVNTIRSSQVDDTKRPASFTTVIVAEQTAPKALKVDPAWPAGLTPRRPGLKPGMAG